jgi:hypothetical protein
MYDEAKPGEVGCGLFTTGSTDKIQLWLLTIYDKDEAVDLTPEQRNILKAAIASEKKSRTRR